MLTFRASDDGMRLVLRKIIEEHNHVINRVRISLLASISKAICSRIALEEFHTFFILLFIIYYLLLFYYLLFIIYYLLFIIYY